MLIRKIRNQPLYRVTNDDGTIVGVFDSKKEAKKVVKEMIGGAISGKSLKSILKSSYNRKKTGDVEGYTLDKELSGRRVKTYIDNATGEVVMVNRGTQGFQDMVTDAKLFFVPKSQLKSMKRFQYADNMLKKIEDKYGKGNVNVIGHSLGSKIAETIADENHKNIITYNKPVLPFRKSSKKSNQVDIKTTFDPVSAFDTPTANDIVLPSKTYDPLREHSLGALDDYLLDDIMIGGKYYKIKKKY